MPQDHLTTAALYIILSLSTKERHGYDIMKQVEATSDGAVHLGPATLYTTIKRLLKAGYIQEVDERNEVEHGHEERRRYYALTVSGKEMARSEIHRLDHLVRTFKSKVA
jgi:DNA-binding PadR family transcriptional regulator